jgi:hypothetical protein
MFLLTGPRGRTFCLAQNAKHHCSLLFELARVLVRLDHVASFIVNANHRVMRDSRHIHTLIPPKMTRASALGHSGKW